MAFMNLCMAGQVSQMMLSQDKLRINQVHGAANLEELDSETRPINPQTASSMSLRERRRQAKLPASTIYYQGSLHNFRNFFLFFMFGAILAEMFRFRTVYHDMQAELELRYEDEYYIWREVFVYDVNPEHALASNAERRGNPINQYGNPNTTDENVKEIAEL